MKIRILYQLCGVRYVANLKQGYAVQKTSQEYAWIDGSSNQKSSNVMDHASSDQHKAAMMKLREDQAKTHYQPVSSYSTIAKAMSTIDPATEEKTKRKFEICFVLAKENLPFSKYPAILSLEKRHGVDFGNHAYETAKAAQRFVHFIAAHQRSSFNYDLNAPFFSVLMDGSADKSRVENELFAVVYCRYARMI